jgi:acyl-coenzyme A synthetase/AMP-(fatty) acid ligase
MKLYTNELVERIYRQASERPEAVALQDSGGHKISYRALAGQVDTLAVNLVQRGLRKGDRALILVRPGLPVVVLALALIRAGGSLLLADPGMGRGVFESRVRLAQPKWVFVESLLLGLQRLGPVRRALRLRGVEVPDISSIGDVTTVSIGPRLPFSNHSLALNETQIKSAWEEEPLQPDDEAVIVFTSGTTGLPRGVIHTAGSLRAAMDLATTRLQVAPSDVVYASSLHLVVPALCSGARTILPPLEFRPARFVDHLRRHRVTVTFGMPGDLEQVITLCNRTGRRLPESLAQVMLGSAPVSRGFCTRLQGVLPPAALAWDVYGLTEMAPVCSISLSEKLADKGPGDLVGCPLPGVSVRVAPDGELVVAGPHLYSRYLGCDGPPARELATGDTARIDEQGRVILTGRKKDMIIKRGRNIYPSLFEPAILNIPGVRDCALIGLYHGSTSEEEIVLVVERAPGADSNAVERRLRRELLAGPFSIDTYAQPDRIIFAALPRTGRSDKIDKKRLRQLLAEGEL